MSSPANKGPILPVHPTWGFKCIWTPSPLSLGFLSWEIPEIRILGWTRELFSHKSRVIDKKVVERCLKFCRKIGERPVLSYKPTAQLFFSIHGNNLLFAQVALNETRKGSGPFVTAPGAITMPIGACSLQGPLRPLPPGSRPPGFLLTEIRENVLPSLLLHVSRWLDPLCWGWSQLSFSCLCAGWSLPPHFQFKTVF